MSKLKKYFSLVLLLVFVVGCLSGCGSSDNKLIVGTNAYFPPYEFYENTDIIGIDVDIIKEVGKRLNKDVVITDMEFDTLLSAVKMGRVNAVIAGMTVTDERLKEVDFTDSYATGIQKVIVLSDSKIATLDDLKGKKIGVQKGTTGSIYAFDDDLFDADKITEYSKFNEMERALKGGFIEAILIDSGPAISSVRKNHEFKLLDTDYIEESYAIAVQKNSSLKDEINKCLAEMKEDGTIDRIVASYIKEE